MDQTCCKVRAMLQYFRPLSTSLRCRRVEEAHNSAIRDGLGRGQRMGRGGAMWNDRVFLEVFVGTWGSVVGIEEPSYVGNGDL